MCGLISFLAKGRNRLDQNASSYEWIDIFEGDRQQELYAFYSKQWWTRGRTFEDVIRMIQHSDVVLGCCTEDGTLAGFARVLTDYTFKALIFDVIVREDFRGKGLGQVLVRRIIDHEALTMVRSFELYCPEALIPFYEKIGFERGKSALLFNQH
jgi:GNAT superfamily N-acetyltransferase